MKMYLCCIDQRLTPLLLAAAVFLQNVSLLTDATAAMDPPSVSVVRRPASVSVEHPTQRGVLYQLESSGGLSTWEPSGPARYGTGALLSTVVYVPPPPPDDPTPPPPWDAPARWISFFITPINITQTVVGFFEGGRFQRVLLTSSNFLTPNFHPRVALRQNEGTPSNPSDDVILDCDFLLFGWSRDLLLLPRSDEDFPGISAPHKADLHRLIAARTALMAANQHAIDNPLPAGPPQPPGPHRYYRLKVSTLDSDGDGVYDSDEFLAGTNPYANPALNPPGNTSTASNPTGLNWKPFWKRLLPEVTIQQKWRTAEINILEGKPPTGSGNGPMSRSGSVQNHSMAAARTTGLSSPIPLLSQVRNDPRDEILRSWATPLPVVLEPAETSPEWKPWLASENKPLHARYRCEQRTPNPQLHPDGKWLWLLNGEERLFRIVCNTAAPEILTRHFLQVKRSRHWLAAAGMPDWTYEPTTVVTLTIPAGGTTGSITGVSPAPPVSLLFPNHPEKDPSTTVSYIAKTTEIEEIYLPVEIQSPTRTEAGSMLGKISTVRQQTYAPELRIAKLFPGLDVAGAAYSPIQAATPFAIVPEEDPDSFTIRVHDASGVWKQLANPTSKPGVRVTTASPSPYQQFYSDQSATNQALFQVDAANTDMLPGWLASKSMFLVSNFGDNQRLMNGAKDGARNDTSRIVLPGGTVTIAFPGWQRSASPPTPDKIVSFNLPVPVAAKATLDMKMFRDADVLSPTNITTLFKEKLEAINEHYAQVGIVYSYITNSGDISGYNSRTAAHEVGHLLTNKGHFGGPASTGNNYQSLATTQEKGFNLMTEGPWGTLTWPFTHQRLSDEQENYIFTRGAIWLRNP